MKIIKQVLGNWFQIKYMLMVLFIVAFVSAVIGGGIYYTVKAGLSYQLPDVGEHTLTSTMLFSEVNSFLTVLLPVMFVFVALVSLVILHKIAGPEYKLEKSLSAFALGDFTLTTELIKGDELVKLIKILNNAKKNLSNMVSEEINLVNTTISTADELFREISADKMKKDRVLSLIKDLQSSLEKLQVVMNRYKIEKTIK
ncbi:MAG: hypothetical protein AABY84_07225 [Candidatus Firestonebacteria bacterium]